jgi:hypothetical protein
MELKDIICRALSVVLSIYTKHSFLSIFQDQKQNGYLSFIQRAAEQINL